MKSRNLIITLGLLIIALATGLGGYWYYRYASRLKPDIAKVGGTVLVYELDETSLPPNYQADEMTAALQRRFDSSDAFHVTVRAAGDKRFELVVPRRKGNHQEDLNLVKDLIAHQGRLEFLIVANKKDDEHGIQDVRDHLTNPANKAALEKAAKAGLPPPMLLGADGKPALYDVNLDGAVSRHSYAWVEMSKAELVFLHLHEEAAEWGGPPRELQMRQTAAKTRDLEPFELNGNLVYSRTF